MEHTPTILETRTKIRFQHCDPFNHLNNAEYLNYMVNAREDHLIEHYGIDIYGMARKQGKSWVVGSNQIAYIRPAFTMETVLIQSQLLDYKDSSILVEIRMYDESGQHIKAVMWSEYVHFNLIAQKREMHDEEFTSLFSRVKSPVEETTFEERVFGFRKQKAVVGS